MLVEVEECLEALRCPRTGSKLARVSPDVLKPVCPENPEMSYRLVDGKPVMIDFSESVFSEGDFLRSKAASPIERKQYGRLTRFFKKLLSPTKKSTVSNVSRLVDDLQMTAARPAKLLVIGGGSIGQGMEPLYEHPEISVYSFDVYASPLTQFIADAHQIPLPDDFFDAVVIQAVLEHVLQPAQVVSEIWRVLSDKGLVYAETPFMQQVHEGAFDFTRFSESGHRYLFRWFETISSGANGGPGTQFMWSVDYLVRSVFRSVMLGKLAKLAFFWTQYLDAIIPARFAEDGASGVYFYGRKAQAPISPKAIIAHYQGAQGRHA
ncbi:SAM-dependent methyltransferase [Ensifer sp. NM-2]|uniref:class I SAM-dependent methyltransferase n=2 Tax=Ensifer TaxID=106591 RepID=UPI000D12240B|nr:class I SAM-dependent methyltransferase [Ensifer sp. NM-2]PSS62241.1 SAM-dependent methyltransferase [Ensifer sp. NM-2]